MRDSRAPARMGHGTSGMISVIMPVLNEQKALPATLDALRRQPGAFETIVVDGGSSDRTLEILAQYPWTKVISAHRGRARQMNAGACVATGEWLLFLHADTLLPDGALARLRAWHDRQDIEAGGFRHRFSGDRSSLRLISWIDNLRCRYSRIIYGDQAMFIRKGLFMTLGGFSEQATMEDVEFCERLLSVTAPRLIADPVITSSRKFEQMGIWRSFLRVAVILVRHQLGLRVPRGRFFSDIR